MWGPKVGHGATDLQDRRLYCTSCKTSVEDLKGFGDQVAPGPFMIQELASGHDMAGSHCMSPPHWVH